MTPGASGGEAIAAFVVDSAVLSSSGSTGCGFEQDAEARKVAEDSAVDGATTAEHCLLIAADWFYVVDNACVQLARLLHGSPLATEVVIGTPHGSEAYLPQLSSYSTAASVADIASFARYL